MKLKTATLLAIIGSAIALGMQLYSIYNYLQMKEDYEWILTSMITNAIWALSHLLLLLFFVTLFKNQKK